MMKKQLIQALNKTILVALVAGLTTSASATTEPKNSCPSDGIYLQVLGSGGPEADDGRTSTSYLIWVDGRSQFMIDMGGGSLWRFEQSGARIEDLQAILFTHFHVDHSADFPVLVKSAFFTDRQDELPIYGPNDTGKTGYLVNTTTFVKRLFSKTEGVYPYLSSYFDPSSDSRYHFTAHNVPIDNDKPMQIKKTEEYKLSSVPVNHGFLPAIAWRLDIKTKNGYKSITVSGDMNGERGTLEQLAKNTDLLIAHTAIHQHTQGAGAFLHMKPKTIGAIAKKAQAKSLLLSHFMKRSLNRQTEITEQISENYKGPINFATDLSCWKVD